MHHPSHQGPQIGPNVGKSARTLMVGASERLSRRLSNPRPFEDLSVWISLFLPLVAWNIPRLAMLCQRERYGVAGRLGSDAIRAAIACRPAVWADRRIQENFVQRAKKHTNDI